MNTLNKKSERVRNILLACFLFTALFCLCNHHFSAAKQKTESEKQREYVAAYHNPVIAQNYEVRILKSLHSSLLLNSTTENSGDKNAPEQIAVKDFSQIKILLKQSNYNLYFASGFHEPPLAA